MLARMPDEDRERVIRLLKLRDPAWDMLASFILDAHCDPAHILASLDEVRTRLGTDLQFRSVEEALTTAREIADTVLNLDGTR